MHIQLKYEQNLRFGYDLDRDRLSLELSLLALGPASVTKMPSTHLLPQLKLGPKVLPIPEAFV